MSENVIVGVNEYRKEQIREFIIRKYSPPGLTDYEVMKVHYQPPKLYIDAIESLITSFEEATLEQRIDVLVELMGFASCARKSYLEGEIVAYAEKGPISHTTALTLSAVLVIMRYTHDVGSRESLRNFLESLNKLKGK